MSTKAVMDTTMSGRRRYRSRPEALKPEIVAASFASGSSVSIVARKYDVNANQVFSWRKRYRQAADEPSGPSAPQLTNPGDGYGDSACCCGAASTVAEKIEIDVAGKYRVRIGSTGFDGQALRRVLDLLERR